MSSADFPNTTHLRSAIRASYLSIVWTLIASVIAVGIGVSKSNLVLVAFGLTGLLDAAGSIALVVHFRHALRHDALSDRHERIALSVVTMGLLLVAILTAVESIRRVVQHTHGEKAIFGVGLAGVSVVVLFVLAYWKRRLGRAVPSPALIADSWLSLTGALLALVTVMGTFLAGIGWWWADPAAALAVATGALVIGVLLRKGEENSIG